MDEQQRGLSIKASPMTMLLQVTLALPLFRVRAWVRVRVRVRVVHRVNPNP